MTDYAGLIPVNVITGFLGSGKTTLLQRLLASPDLSDAAVLINEFGDVGLDHHLVQPLQENTVLLASGCLCCTIRGDLTLALRDLYDRRERGAVPAFRRVLLETTGLADPAPVAFTLLSDPVIRHHFRLGNLIATVDAVNGRDQLERYPESVKQAALADRLVLTKTDLATEAQTRELKRQVRRLNAQAPFFDAARETVTPNDLLLQDLYDPQGRMREISHWLEPGTHDDPAAAGAPHDRSRHDGPSAGLHGRDIHTFSLVYERPLDWTAFGIWLTLLLHRHGTQVLRVKGILNVAGMSTPVAIHGVQHLVHPPAHLPGWSGDDRRSRIVFIVDGLSRARIEASLGVFMGLAEDSVSAAADRGRGAQAT
jgi:G3E family GTPase